ncbi:MAG: hypothetical protein QXN86_00475 [Candidatus Methanomethylicaceae archaeon]
MNRDRKPLLAKCTEELSTEEYVNTVGVGGGAPLGGLLELLAPVLYQHG